MQTSKYNVSHFILDEQEQTVGGSAYERRRIELKNLTLERRRMVEELILMKEEDKHSHELRDIDRMERQRKQLIAELGDLYLTDDGDESTDSQHLQGKQVKIPSWMTVPSKWEEWTVDMQLKYVMMMEKWKIKDVAKNKSILRDQKRVEAMEKKSLDTWQVEYDSECHKLWKSELSHMEAIEESKVAEHDLSELKENIRRLVIFCQRKGEIELRIKTRLRKKEAIAKKRDQELADATRW
eukprot:CAMPEP_0182433658 /NCGR_PEP_ID=MMETSP1167-20130531/64720_1 /TAXON_ID=2988 /ORGANISM="Mallomonas Sp, Strain CCMP3275" /LENGTH=238 /DNA_ID=CAMNT_0024622617 /DNA_START=168 /DNA_END=881 /DNA_ORIENTATION=-